MKVFISTILLLISSVCFAVNPTSGSKSAYQYDPSTTLSAAPDGYSPFYINHVGRHGSRYISKPKYEEITHKILKLANDQKQLTPAGQQLLLQVERISQLNQGHYGELSELGQQDINKIAQRMLNNYPTIFQGNHIEVLSTTSQRAKDSAMTFVQPFTPHYPNVEIKQQPENQQFLLRFFEYSPEYTNYQKSESIEDLIKSIENADKTKAISLRISENIFDKPFINQLNKGIKGINKGKIKTNEFAIALFALYQELLSFTPEILAQNKLNFDPYFSDAERQWLTTVITAKNYLQIGPAFDINGIQIKIAAPLLQEIIRSSEYAIVNQSIDANFRFAHAETISPLATLLELEGTAKITDLFYNYPQYWKAEEIIPMGANIQFIFYRHSDTTLPVLAKILLNEREVHLPISTDHYPYYNWNDIKSFYEKKLLTLGLSNQ